jgi:uncharacterized membrane protein
MSLDQIRERGERELDLLAIVMTIGGALLWAVVLGCVFWAVNSPEQIFAFASKIPGFWGSAQ